MYMLQTNMFYTYAQKRESAPLIVFGWQTKVEDVEDKVVDDDSLLLLLMSTEGVYVCNNKGGSSEKEERKQDMKEGRKEGWLIIRSSDWITYT